MLRKDPMKPERYMSKATHNMDFSNWLLKKHKDEIPELFGKETFYDWVITGYYYAIYHSAMALIATKRLSSKSNSATLAAVILHFYHEKKIEKKDVEIIAGIAQNYIDEKDIETVVDSKSMRERASYGVGYEFDEALVNTAKSNASRFIEKVQILLASQSEENKE